MENKKIEGTEPKEGKPTPEVKSEAQQVKEWATGEIKKLNDKVKEIERKLKL